jgi:hypothetical protein
MLAGGCRDFDLAVDHEQPGTFVDLVVRESLAGCEVEHDYACDVARGEDLR